MLELLQAVFLGIVQGLTMFLPVSSSGHLLLSQYFLGMDQGRFGLPFDAAIHTGTVLAVVLFFRRDLLSMARAFFRSLPRPDFSDAEVRLAYLILVATVSAGLIGFFFEDFFTTEVRSPWVVVFNLVFVGVLFLLAESVGRKTEVASKLGPLGAFGVGCLDQGGANLALRGFSEVYPTQPWGRTHRLLGAGRLPHLPVVAAVRRFFEPFEGL